MQDNELTMYVKADTIKEFSISLEEDDKCTLENKHNFRDPKFLVQKLETTLLRLPSGKVLTACAHL